MVEYCVYWLENGEPMHEVFSNLTPIVYASQHSIYPRLWVSLSPYKDNLMGEKCPRIWGKNYQVGRK